MATPVQKTQKIATIESTMVSTTLSGVVIVLERIRFQKDTITLKKISYLAGLVIVLIQDELAVVMLVRCCMQLVSSLIASHKGYDCSSITAVLPRLG